MTFQELYAGQRVCYFCAHYQQHYYREETRYIEVYCGHCREPRIKSRKPDQSCALWTAAISGEESDARD